jgi:hypothetical protein
MQKPLVISLEEVAQHQIFYKIGDKTNYHFKQKTTENTEVVFENTQSVFMNTNTLLH